MSAPGLDLARLLNVNLRELRRAVLDLLLPEPQYLESTRRPTHGGPMSRELQPLGCPPGCLGSYWGVPTIPPGRTFTC